MSENNNEIIIAENVNEIEVVYRTQVNKHGSHSIKITGSGFEIIEMLHEES